MGNREQSRTARERGAVVRQSTAWLLVVVFAVVSVAAVMSGFVRYRLLDTDQYVAATNALADDSAIQNYVIDVTTNAIVAQTNLDELISRSLQSAAGVAPDASRPTSADRAVSIIRGAVSAVVKSPQFSTGWEALNRQAHSHLVDILTGSHQYVELGNDGVVSLRLGSVAAAAEERLVAAGFPWAASIPAVNRQLELIHAPALHTGRAIVQPIVRAAPVLPWVAFMLAALAVVIAVEGRRMRMLAGLGWGLSIAMAMAAVALAYCRDWYLGQVPTEVMPRDAARAVFDALLGPLWPVIGAVAVGGLIVGLLAELSPRVAARTRYGMRPEPTGTD